MKISLTLYKCSFFFLIQCIWLHDLKQCYSLNNPKHHCTPTAPKIISTPSSHTSTFSLTQTMCLEQKCLNHFNSAVKPAHIKGLKLILNILQRLCFSAFKKSLNISVCFVQPEKKRMLVILGGKWGMQRVWVRPSHIIRPRFLSFSCAGPLYPTSEEDWGNLGLFMSSNINPVLGCYAFYKLSCYFYTQVHLHNWETGFCLNCGVNKKKKKKHRHLARCGSYALKMIDVDIKKL